MSAPTTDRPVVVPGGGQAWDLLGYPAWARHRRVEVTILSAVPAPAPEPVREADVAPTDGLRAGYKEAARLVAAAEDGLTARELEEATGWGHGTASGALSRAESQGLVARGDEKRGRHRVYRAVPQ